MSSRVSTSAFLPRCTIASRPSRTLRASCPSSSPRAFTRQTRASFLSLGAPPQTPNPLPRVVKRGRSSVAYTSDRALLFERPDILAGEHEECFAVLLEETERPVEVFLRVSAGHVDSQALLAL